MIRLPIHPLRPREDIQEYYPGVRKQLKLGRFFASVLIENGGFDAAERHKAYLYGMQRVPSLLLVGREKPHTTDDRAAVLGPYVVRSSLQERISVRIARTANITTWLLDTRLNGEDLLDKD